MATATLKAKPIEDICTKRIAALNKGNEEAVQAWIKSRLATKKTEGRFWWKRSYYPTLAEVEDDLDHTSDYSWWSSRYYITKINNSEIHDLRKIERTCREAQERGDGKVSLDSGEIASVRYANTVNGDDIQPELEPS